jgi:hypothetical protein
MNGDRLKALEQGFLDGSLSAEEEVELKTLVSLEENHPLKSYFQWTADGQHLEVPDMRNRVILEDASVKSIWPGLIRVAATLILLLSATFIFWPGLYSTKPAEKYSQTEIDKSYKATIETLSAMASFLNQGIKDTGQCMDISAPFKELNTLDNIETQEQ